MSMINLSNKIKEYRSKKGWSQKELAKRSGVPYKTLLKIEQGISKEPSIQTVYKIAITFNISIDQLIIDETINHKIKNKQ